MKIDAHQHLWNPARGDYGWMPPDDPVLSRPYLPTDLIDAAGAVGIERTVIVQAAPTTHETEYMLGLADATPMIGAVVGWIDFEDEAEVETLTRFAGHEKFRGVRPMIQDIADDDWMMRDDVQWAYDAVAGLGLSFDALGFPKHLPNLHSTLTRYPDLPAVIDHFMKPKIGDKDGWDHWAGWLTRIAKETEAQIKLSGLVTEGPDGTGQEALQPYVDHVLGAFGPDRIMWGSDWPVLRLRREYGDWLSLAEALTSQLSADEAGLVFGGTAKAFYDIDSEVPL